MLFSTGTIISSTLRLNKLLFINNSLENQTVKFSETVTGYYHQYTGYVPSYFHLSYLHLFSGGKYNSLHAKSRYKQGNVLALNKIKVEMPTLEGKNTFPIHHFPHRTRLFHLFTENGRTQSDRDGHQGVYSHAILFISRIMYFPKLEKKIFPYLGK